MDSLPEGGRAQSGGAHWNCQRCGGRNLVAEIAGRSPRALSITVGLDRKLLAAHPPAVQSPPERRSALSRRQFREESPHGPDGNRRGLGREPQSADPLV